MSWMRIRKRTLLSFPVPRGKYFDLLPALPLNNCILDYEEENVMIEIPDYH
jgi:hypothetical protein